MSHDVTPALRHADLFHTGVVVDDLDDAKQEMGSTLALSWHEGGGKVRVETPDGVEVVRTSYALSRQGPHHLELCQSIPGTLWSASPPGQAHHVGFWVSDVAASSEALERRGSAVIATITPAEGAAPICAYHRTRNGLYVEIVSAAMRSVLLPQD